MTTLRKYLDVVKAEMDKSLLESAGIPAFVAGENSATIGYGGILAEVHLQVEDADADRARQILQDNKEATPLSDDFIPPEAPPSEKSELKTTDPDNMRIVRSVVVTLIVVFAIFAAFRWWTINGATFYYNRGINLQAKGNLEGAIADYDRAIESNPNFARAYFNRGRAKESKGELDGAIADYDSVIKLVPKDSHAYDNRGVAKRAKGDLVGAINDFNKAIELDPENANAYNNRALIRHVNGNLDGAIADYDNAIELRSMDARFYNNRGLAKRDNNDLAGAIADYDKAIELDPKYAHAYDGRGSVKRAKGDLDGAVADYNQAIELDPKYALAYNNRGFAKKAKGDLAGAIADYNRAIELDPKAAYAYSSRAFVKRMKGDSDGALTDYDRAIELDPKNLNAWYGHGVVRYDKREWSNALSDFHKTSALKSVGSKLPDYTSIRIWMTRSKLGERNEATKELKEYLSTRTIGKPGDWPSTIVRFLTGDISESDFLNAAINSDEEQTRNQKCEAYYYAGTLRLINGERSTAADYFSKCIDTGATQNYEYQSAAAEFEALKQ